MITPLSKSEIKYHIILQNKTTNIPYLTIYKYHIIVETDNNTTTNITSYHTILV